MAEASALLAEYRRRADDTAEPPLIPDETVFAMLSEGEREACLRGAPIFDTVTADVVLYAVAADQATVTLDSRILRIDHATFTPTGGRARKLCLTGIDEVRSRCLSTTASRPDYACHESRTTLKLYPTPSTAGTLTIDVYRLPLLDIEDGGDEPEIPLELHDGLVDWVLYRVYSTKDSELYDLDRAGLALRDFTERFGERRNADAMRRHRERRRVTTRNIYP